MREKERDSELNAYIGAKLKQKRLEKKISQEKLGEQLGVTHQQIQKYENGKNMIRAGVLYEASKILGVRMDYFVKNYPENSENS